MKKEQGNVKIDLFRMAAAYLVVAIHTAPFSNVNETIDQMFSYGIARVGVPFFLMITGYFVLAPYYQNKSGSVERLKKYLWKLLRLYGISILLYLPINVYAGQLPDSFGIWCKNLVFDGTFYHLWYLPAAVMGCMFLLVLMKLLGNRGTGVSVVLLYFMGLLGDSYYGLICDVPVLKSIYKAIFTISSYTRNGVFYVPIFLWIGMQFARFKERGEGNTARNFYRRTMAAGLGISTGLMLVEGFLTWHYKLQKHNSMYVFLIPVMFFLFWILITQGEKEKSHKTAKYKSFREISMWIYIIHPLCIIAIRGGAKAVGIKVLVDNSLVHYAAVCILATAGAVVIRLVWKKGKEMLLCMRKEERG